MNEPELSTKNLRLVPHTPKGLRALMDGEAAYERVAGLRPAEGLREFYVSGEVSPQFLASLETAAESDVWTHGFAIVHLESRMVIGACGFKGAPGKEGVAEIAYGIVPTCQGRGYATEAAQALIDFASAHGVRMVRAHTLPQENASTRVLCKSGFQRLGEVMDPEDGLVWRWERKL